MVLCMCLSGASQVTQNLVEEKAVPHMSFMMVFSMVGTTSSLHLFSPDFLEDRDHVLFHFGISIV